MTLVFPAPCGPTIRNAGRLATEAPFIFLASFRQLLASRTTASTPCDPGAATGGAAEPPGAASAEAVFLRCLTLRHHTNSAPAMQTTAVTKPIRYVGVRVEMGMALWEGQAGQAGQFRDSPLQEKAVGNQQDEANADEGDRTAQNQARQAVRRRRQIDVALREPGARQFDQIAGAPVAKNLL